MSLIVEGVTTLIQVFDMPTSIAFDPDAAYEHLLAKGIETQPPKVAPYGMKQLYVEDPDGYVICFQSPASERETSDS